MPTYSRDGNINISISDIRDAGADGVISPDDAERLIHWLSGQAPEADASPETAKGLNAVTVAYYFGAMLMISACAWFLGDKWESLGSRGVFATALVYMAVALGVGLWLRARGYVVGGGLLVTVAVCLVPLLTYTIEDMLGMWPAAHPGEYAGFYPRVHASWIVMELATIGAAALALRFVPFGFLTAP